MAVTPTPIFPQSIFNKVIQFTSSTSTSIPTSFITPQVNGCKIEQIIVSNSDTNAHDVNVYFNAGSTNYQVCAISIPATAGIVDSVPAVNLFKAVTGSSTMFPLALDANGDPYLYLDNLTSVFLQPGATTAVTSGKTINIVAMGGAF